jgi:hypothetical protein
MSIKPDPNYDLVPALPQQAKKGSQCGECGGKFDYGSAYGFRCGNQRCPMQLKLTYSTTTTMCGLPG